MKWLPKVQIIDLYYWKLVWKFADVAGDAFGKCAEYSNFTSALILLRFQEPRHLRQKASRGGAGVDGATASLQTSGNNLYPGLGALILDRHDGTPQRTRSPTY